jgi:hypothetical protein
MNPARGADYCRLGSAGRAASARLETDSTVPLPLRGTVSTRTVPFGDTLLTLVTSPRSALAGTGPQALPQMIPVIASLEVAVRYRAAANSAAIGGDRYDLVPLEYSTRCLSPG